MSFVSVSSWSVSTGVSDTLMPSMPRAEETRSSGKSAASTCVTGVRIPRFSSSAHDDGDDLVRRRSARYRS